MDEQEFKVDAPAGGSIHLRSQEEVDLYTEMAEAYMRDYRLGRSGEKVLLGALLTQALTLFRCQQDLSGVKERYDTSGIGTGEYVRAEVTAAERQAIQKMMEMATKEIRATEIALGIDKKSRDAGSNESVATYISTVKRAGHRMGVHIHKRVFMYEAFVKELGWRVRLNKNGDAEDKKYHDISPEKICEWIIGQIAEMEEYDKQFAKSQKKLFGGKL